MEITKMERLIRACRSQAKNIEALASMPKPSVPALWQQHEKYMNSMSELVPAEDNKEALKTLEEYGRKFAIRIAEIQQQEAMIAEIPPPRNVTINNPVNQQPKVEKPKLREVTHDGQIGSYRIFWSIFETSVIKNDNLDENEKCRHLLAAVTADDAELIAGLPLDEMVSRLEKKYKSKTSIEKMMVEKIRAVKMKHSRDVNGLRQVSEMGEKMFMAVKGVKENGSLSEKLFSLLYTNLPNDMQDRVLEATDNRQDVEKMIDKLKSELERLEAHHEALAIIDTQVPKQSYVKEQSKMPGVDFKDICRFCREPGHFVRNCEKLKENVCKKCGVKGHSGKFCVNKESKQYIRSSVHSVETNDNWREKKVDSIGAHKSAEDNRPRINLKWEGGQTEAIVDTGACVTVLPVEQLEKVEAPLRIFSTMSGTLATKGPVVKQFQLGDRQCEEEIFVANTKEALIGADLLKKHEAVVDMKDGSVLFNKPMENKEKEDEAEEKCSQSRVKLEQLIERNKDLMEGIGKCDIIEHHIPTDGTIVHVRNRRLPVHQLENVAEHVREMIQEDIIEESSSDFCSPILPIKKKDGSMRMALDFRDLNKVTTKDSFPMPRIDEILESVTKARMFSRIDLRKGYYQVYVAQEDRHKTAFQFMGKLYQFKRMPFGLCTAPQTFQRLMRIIMADLPYVQCYLDDIIVFSTDEDQHVGHLEEVFKRLREAGLRLNGEKCLYGEEEIEFLGFHLHKGVLSPSDEKTKTLKNYPSPTSKKALRGFLGFANYLRAFVPDFAQLAKPLYQAQNLKKFSWSDECEEHFRLLKEKLAEKPSLHLPDVNKPFIVTTDASDFGMGAVLYQEVNGERRVVEFMSKMFNDTERRYSVIEKEATAIKEALDKWRHFLLGSKFKIESDHKPLHWLLTKKDCSGKLGRLALWLQEFDIEGIEYIKGEDNVVADALSRIEIALIGNTPTQTSRRIEDLLKRDPNRFKRIEGRVWLIEKDSRRLCIESTEEREAILVETHEANGHLGMYKTLEEVRRRFYWPNWNQDVKAHLKSCFKCATYKDDVETNKEEMKVMESSEVFERVHLDVCGQWIESGGQKYICVLQDAYSKWLEVKAIPRTTTKIITTWLDEIFARLGHPQTITTDCASYLESREFAEYCEARGITHHLATAYHHQGNGLVERGIQTLEKMVRTTIAENQGDWSRVLTDCVEAYNGSRHHTTGVSPFSLMFNRHPRRRVDLKHNIEVPQLDAEWNATIAAVNTRKSQSRMKRVYDRKVKRKVFKVGELVLWHVLEQGVGTSKKLNRKWKGPFVIDDITKPTAMLKDGRGRLKKVHLNHLKHCWSNQPLAEFRFRGRPRI